MRALATPLALGRIGVGSVLLAAPKLASGWIGRDAGRKGTQVMVRALAARDLALGVGTAIALLTGRPAKTWHAVALIADGTDLAATLAVRDKLPDSGVNIIIGAAGSAIAVCAAYVAFGERGEGENEPVSPSATADTSAPVANRSQASATFPSGSST